MTASTRCGSSGRIRTPLQLRLHPDGPRGPRYCFQPGAVYFASRAGLPIILITVTYDRCWRLRTWDEFIVPRPFARALIRASGPVEIPPDLADEELEKWRRLLEDELRRLTNETDERLEELYATAGSWKEYAREQDLRARVTPRR